MYTIFATAARSATSCIKMHFYSMPRVLLLLSLSAIVSLTGCSARQAKLQLSQAEIDAALPANSAQHSQNLAHAKFEREKYKIQQQDKHADFSRLRQLYSLSDAFSPWNSAEHEAALILRGTIEDEDYELCMKLGRALIHENFTNLDGHFALYQCATQLEQAELAEFHAFTLRGLYQSIKKSGDGLTPNSAYQCLSRNEARAFIRLLGLLEIKDDVVSHSPRHILRFELSNDQDEATLIRYIDITPATLASFGTGLQSGFKTTPTQQTDSP